MRLFLLLLTVLTAVPSWAAISCPNEPAGSTLVAETPFDVKTGSGFIDTYEQAGMQSYMSIVSGQNDPASSANALQAYYPVGHPGGNGTGKIMYEGSGRTAFFVCFWMKLDNPFENHRSSGTKILYVHGSNDSHPYYFLFRNTDPPYGLWMISQGGNDLDNRHLGGMCPWPGTCNLQPNGSGSVKVGVWQLYELYLKQSSSVSARDGVAKWWIDSNLAGNYPNLNTLPQDLYGGIHINPVFGGAADQNKTQVDYMWFGHVKISDPGGGPPVEPPPPLDPVRISLLTTDPEGASVGITGPAKRLRYWDDFTGTNKPELPDYVPLSSSYRLVKRWPVGTTFACLQAQGEGDVWMVGYHCNSVRPGVTPPPPAEQCQDLKDNDGDGKIDFPADPGCTDKFDTDETDAVVKPQCSDGLDNDGDGKIDYPADPGCKGKLDKDERDEIVPPPESVFSNVVIGTDTISFQYKKDDCPRVTRDNTGTKTKTVTMTCVTEAETLTNKKKGTK